MKKTISKIAKGLATIIILWGMLLIAFLFLVGFFGAAMLFLGVAAELIGVSLVQLFWLVCIASALVSLLAFLNK